MINNNLFSIIIPPLCIYKLMVTYVCTAGVEKEGLRTMENAWSTMEKFFWDETFGLYKVPMNMYT